MRKVVPLSGFSYSSPCPWDTSITLGRALLEPTRIYISQILPVLKAGGPGGPVKALSHITGGGFTENIPRVLPKDLGVWIDAAAWPLPPVFHFIKRYGNVTPSEMARTFNNGIGMILVVAAEKSDEVLNMLKSHGQAEVYKIGQVKAGAGVDIRNLEAWQ